jgi:hypothetical protein
MQLILIGLRERSCSQKQTTYNQQTGNSSCSCVKFLKLAAIDVHTENVFTSSVTLQRLLASGTQLLLLFWRILTCKADHLKDSSDVESKTEYVNMVELF